MRLDAMARVVRSKNAGPRKVTFDIMFDDEAHYRRVRDALPRLRAEAARLYRTPENKLLVIDYPPAMAIKIVMDRAVMAGNPGDRDAYGAQQHAPLLGIEL
jgi:hypothetical protein